MPANVVSFWTPCSPFPAVTGRRARQDRPPRRLRALLARFFTRSSLFRKVPAESSCSKQASAAALHCIAALRRALPESADETRKLGSKHACAVAKTPNMRCSSYQQSAPRLAAAAINSVNSNGGHQNFTIDLLEAYPCSNLDELLKREKHFHSPVQFGWQYRNVAKSTDTQSRRCTQSRTRYCAVYCDTYLKGKLLLSRCLT